MADKPAKALPPRPLLLHLFRYDFGTGKLYWRNPRARNKKPGDEAGCIVHNGRQTYRIVNIGKVLYLAHRIIWVMHKGPLKRSERIDHEDRDGLNNRLDNLRKATKQLNAFNAAPKRHNTSGFTGVTYDKSKGKWAAQIILNRRTIHLGRYGRKADAVAARKSAERRYFESVAQRA